MSSEIIKDCVRKTSLECKITENQIVKTLLCKFCGKVYVVCISDFKNFFLDPWVGFDLKGVIEYITQQIIPNEKEFESMPKKDPVVAEMGGEYFFNRIPRETLTYAEYCAEVRDHITKKVASIGDLVINFIFLGYTVRVTSFFFSNTIQKMTDNTHYYGKIPKYVLTKSIGTTEVIGLFVNKKTIMNYIKEAIPEYKEITDFESDVEKKHGLIITSYNEEWGDVTDESLVFVKKNPTISSPFLIRKGYENWIQM